MRVLGIYIAYDEVLFQKILRVLATITNPDL
jgi:hypothetical protein